MLRQVTLDPRYVALQRELGWYWTAGLSIALLVGSAMVLLPRLWYVWLPLWPLATALLAWWSWRWAEIEYRYMSYEVDEERIEIRSGVIWRSVQNVPRSRVQHTDVSQGPLERKYGLGRLVIFTAGTHHSRVELPGLAHGTALEIRDRLLPRQTSDVV